MKNPKENGNAPLSRAEMSKVKGGITCAAAYQQCHASCGHFSTDYLSRFAPCVAGLTNNQCSPLAGWYVDCPND